MGVLARVTDRILGEVLGHHAQHSRSKGDLDDRVTVRGELDPGPRGAVGEVADHLIEDRQRHRMAERHDLDPALELREEQDLVDQRAGVLDFAACLLDERVDVGAR